MLKPRAHIEVAKSQVHDCKCGGRLSISGVLPDLTVIHSHPWCSEFEAALRDMQRTDPKATLHKAVILPEVGETLIVGDGDEPSDVDHR